MKLYWPMLLVKNKTNLAFKFVTLSYGFQSHNTRSIYVENFFLIWNPIRRSYLIISPDHLLKSRISIQTTYNFCTTKTALNSHQENTQSPETLQVTIVKTRILFMARHGRQILLRYHDTLTIIKGEVFKQYYQSIEKDNTYMHVIKDKTMTYHNNNEMHRTG